MELLNENEQFKQEVEELKIQPGKDKESVILQLAQATYTVKEAEKRRPYYDSLLQAIDNKKN